MSKSILYRWFDETVLDLGRQLRWSYLPPLMVYLAYGVSGLTSVVGAFFIKDYLGLSAAFIAGLAFWAGIPWALKMPLGHLVDLIWRWKALLVFLGAALIAASLLIMYGLIAHTEAMRQMMPVDAWYVLSVLLSPTGEVIETWRIEYNSERTHSSLGDITPEEFARKIAAEQTRGLSSTADSKSERD